MQRVLFIKAGPRNALWPQSVNISHVIGSVRLTPLTKFRHAVPVIYITATRNLSEDAEYEGSAYTMPMGRKGAILMLAIVALCAAAPVLACVTLVPCHSCCRAMMMDCDSETMSAAHPCCQLHSSGTVVPRGRVVTPEPQLGAVQSHASALPPDLDRLAGQSSFFSNAPPPRSQSGASIVLRI
jgi:hypothetical protein